VTAWSILAFVVATVHAGERERVGSRRRADGLFWRAMMLFVVRPWLPRWIGESVLQAGSPGKGLLAWVLAFLLLCGL